MQKTKELKNLPTMKPEESVVIWRMNNGFKTDFQGSCTKVIVQPDPDPRKAPKPVFSLEPSKMRIYLLVYGIWESSYLGIVKPSNPNLELPDNEVNKRKEIVRNLDPALSDAIYDELLILNSDNEDKDEIIKKSDSQ